MIINFFKKFFFVEVNPLIKRGRQSIFEETDALPLPDKINPTHKYFPEEELKWETPFIHLWSVIKISRKELIPGYTWYFMASILSLITPVLVHKFISLINLGVQTSNLFQTIVYGVLLGLCGMLSGLFLQQYFYHTLTAYQIMTNIFNRKIFEHSLKLSLNSRQKNLIGDVVNYMSTDSDSVADFTFVFGELSANIFLLIGIIIMLFYYLGISALFALIILFTMAPFTKFIAKKFSKLDDEMMSLRDKRVTLMTQVLNSIRIVKYFALENSFEKEVMVIRDEELSKRKKLAKSEVLSGLIYVGTTTLVLVVALSVHSYRGNKLDAALIFTCISLFGLLDGPIGDLSHLISRFTNALVGAKRVIHYLKEEVINDEIQGMDQSDNNIGIEINNVTAKYNLQDTPVLENISLTVKPGQSLAIVGSVGAGKSSLLYLNLNELKITDGKLSFINQQDNLKPRISYLPQEAFIINSNLKENLTFGQTPTDDEIKESIYISSLNHDIDNMSGGLLTEIGEKGLNLSGGQKQRVGLARAYLAHPQIILLDDPLSALDSDTENIICERLLFGAWKNITRIVVTHRLHHLKEFDSIIFLSEGKISARGSFDELLKSSLQFREFYEEHSKSHEEIEIQKIVTKTNKENENTRITEDEDREKGAVKSALYIEYIKSLGGNSSNRPLILFLLFFGAITLAILPLLQKYWLSYFSNHQNDIAPLKAIIIYGLIGIGVLILGLINNFFWLERGIKASKFLHDQMLHKILKAPIRFFDSTPIGRILQRFSRDVESVDVYLQWSFISVVNCILQVLISLFLILTIMPLMIIVIIPILLIYYRLQNDYRKSAREAKRLDSIARSPRYAHFKETLLGLSVIRAYSKNDWFNQTFNKHLSHGQRMFYSHYMLNRWFSSRIPLVGGLISIATAIGISLSAYYGLISPGMSGLVTIYSLSFWGYLNWGIRVFADIESRMTSIERLKYFANIESEKDVVDLKYPLIEDSWPKKGEIKFQMVKARYATHLPMILKNINFSVRPGSKVGIMGKTGSGKSTLFQTLFRFIEIEQGEIIIDDLNIAKVPLNRLRKSMAIIPQDPTLFMGSIRSNLDRYNEYSDSEIKSAIKLCGLSQFIDSLPDKEETLITEGGQNLSLGQRQLLCLGRALLTKAKIIVMDEATASVDVKTDALLQEIIRKELAGVTLLIIAHRLGTIKDCDLIVEIANGESKIVKNYSDS